MLTSEIRILGDGPGHDWRVPVLRFIGRGQGPKTYIQAALHAGELPGVAAIHILAALLRQAEAQDQILGDITIVPQANPIGASQWMFGEMQGRFDFATRVNFNRGYPLLGFSQRHTLLEHIQDRPAVEQLKRHLLSMAIDADVMLDLHCDDQSLQYAYMHAAFWPEGSDLAKALDMRAVFLSDGQSDAFEEAVTLCWLRRDEDVTLTRLPGRLAATVELRGTSDVDPDLARKDADGLFAFLQARGVVAGKPPPLAAFTGPSVPLDHIEMIRAVQTGTILFHKTIGDRVGKGERLATIITAPGTTDGEIDIHAPQSGLIVTRISVRFARRGDNLMKIACDKPTFENRRGGALED